MNPQPTPTQPAKPPRRRRGRKWFFYGFGGLLYLLAVIDSVGVALTATPIPVHWEAIPTTGFPDGHPLSIRVLAYAQLSNNQRTLYAGTSNNGVFRSINEGETWTAVNTGLTALNIQTLLTIPQASKSTWVYAGTNRAGIFLSKDSGDTWAPINEGLDTLNITTLIGIPQSKEDFWLYAGTLKGGVFRSKDAGENWTPISKEMVPLSVIAFIAVPQANGQTWLYAGTQKEGIFLSKNGGETWEPINNGLTNLSIQTLIATPQSDGKIWLYAGVNNFGNKKSEIFSSQDGGLNWTVLNIDPTTAPFTFTDTIPSTLTDTIPFTFTNTEFLTTSDTVSVQAFTTIRQINGDVWLYAGTGLSLISSSNRFLASSGMFFSKDKGETWTKIEINIGNRIYHNLIIYSLLSIPQQNGTTWLYIGTEQGLFLSQDEGRNWTAVNKGLTALDVQILAIVPQTDGRLELYAGTEKGGLFRSVDGGQNWRPVGFTNHNQYIQSLTVVPQPDGNVWFYASLFGGNVSLSQDRGQSWTPILADVKAKALTSVPQANGNGSLYLSTLNNEMLRSQNGGQSWEIVDSKLSLNARIFTTISQPNRNITFYASNLKEGIFRSNDGEEWVPVNNGLTAPLVRSLNSVVQPDGSIWLYAGTFNGGLFLSKNEGKSWTNVNSNLAGLTVQAFGFSFQNNKDVWLYAGTFRNGIFFSKDGGNSWTAINNGLTQLDIHAITIVPQKNKNDWIYAGTWGGGIFLSSNRGRNWTPINDGLTELHIHNLTAVSQTDGSTWLYAGTWGGGIFLSSNGGQNWTPINNGLGDLNVHTFTPVSQSNGSIWLYAIMRTGDLFISRNGGEKWEGTSGPKIPSLTSEKFQINFDDEWINGLYEDSYLLPWTTTPSSKDWINGLSFVQQNVTPSQNQLKLHINTEQKTANFYTTTVNGLLLRAENIPLPRIHNWPHVYIRLVANTLSNLTRIQNNPTPIWAGLFLSLPMVIISYIYQRVISPNQLSLKTALWVLVRPNSWLSANGYRRYALQAQANSTLQTVAVLVAPLRQSFTLENISEVFKQKGVVFTIPDLQVALDGLVNQRELLRTAEGWQVTEPVLTEIYQREHQTEWPRLVERTQRENPLREETERFLQEAGFQLTEAGGLGWLAQHEQPLWKRFMPLWIRVVLGAQLNTAVSEELLKEWRGLFGQNESNGAASSVIEGRLAVYVIVQYPTAGDLFQIFAVRSHEKLTIVPLPRSLVLQARLDGNAAAVLQGQIEQYTGQTDLFAINTAVSDVLSFFGRTALLEELQRRLTTGQSVMVSGVRKAGKSSLLGRLREACGWPMAVVDLQGYSRGLPFIYDEALDGWRTVVTVQWPGVALPAGWGHLPEGDSASKAQAFRQAVGELLALLDNQPNRPGLLLLLDEMDILLSESDYADFAGTLRSVAEGTRARGRFALLMAGLTPFLNRVDRLHELRNPFYSFFRELSMPPLEAEDVETMLLSLGGQMGVGFEPEARQLLKDVGGGHPFLIRQLASRAIGERERPLQVTLAETREAILAYVRHSRNYMAESLWGIEAGGPPPAETAILQALAQNQPQAESDLIPAGLPLAEARRWQAGLEHLHDQSLIRPNGTGWEMTIPLYRYWIRRTFCGVDEPLEAISVKQEGGTSG